MEGRSSSYQKKRMEAQGKDAVDIDKEFERGMIVVIIIIKFDSIRHYNNCDYPIFVSKFYFNIIVCNFL